MPKQLWGGITPVAARARLRFGSCTCRRHIGFAWCDGVAGGHVGSGIRGIPVLGIFLGHRLKVACQRARWNPAAGNEGTPQWGAWREQNGLHLYALSGSILGDRQHLATG